MQKTMHCMITYILNFQTDKYMITGGRSMIAWGWRVESTNGHEEIF